MYDDTMLLRGRYFLGIFFHSFLYLSFLPIPLHRQSSILPFETHIFFLNSFMHTLTV